MYSVYQHWDPLKVCIVGRSYPPEFYSWITVPHVRSLFEKIAIETEEDFQAIIKKLQSFSVEILRPDLPTQTFDGEKYIKPPMTPRDDTVMIGNKFYNNYDVYDFEHFWYNNKDEAWPWCNNFNTAMELLDNNNKQKLLKLHNEYLKLTQTGSCYNNIFKHIKDQGNAFQTYFPIASGAMVSRIGKDLYFGTEGCNADLLALQEIIANEFPNTRNHIINTGGHSDGVYCPVCPGLIISLNDVPTYAETFPGWEVVYLPGQSWEKVRPFLKLKEKNRGKWWIPGFESDQDVVDVVETWLGHWTGYVEETVFDVNMLIIDPKNVMVFNYNKQVFDALSRYGITPHIVPFRHRYFWDGGIHCVTSDLHREGTMQDYFPVLGSHY